MPVEYTYDREANIVHANPYGELTVLEIRAFFDDLMHDDSIRGQSIEVVHFERVEDFLFSSAKARGIIEMLNLLRDAKRVRATIFVAKDNLQYGISRMLQTLYEIHDAAYPTQVVSSDEELEGAIQGMTNRP